MIFIKKLVFLILFATFASGLSFSKEAESEKILWSARVSPGRVILAYRFEVDKGNGVISPPVRFFGKTNTSDKYDGEIIITGREDDKSKVATFVQVVMRSLDPTNVGDVMYDYEEPGRVVFEKMIPPVGHPQIKLGVDGVSISSYKISESDTKKVYVIMMEADDINLIKRSYVLRRGQIILWNYVCPAF